MMALLSVQEPALMAGASPNTLSCCQIQEPLPRAVSTKSALPAVVRPSRAGEIRHTETPHKLFACVSAQGPPRGGAHR